MPEILRKIEIPPVDGTPLKRMFWSIVSDYDVKTGLCELIDNAIDLWTQGGRKRDLNVHVNLDVDRQLIEVIDNAGGVRRDDLPVLVAPGGSKNAPESEVIGIFGVGGKRAGVALGEQVEIRTRYRSEQTLQVDITKDWLSSSSWEMPAYQIPNIQSGTTKVEISKLRKVIEAQDVLHLTDHISQTYGWFLDQGCSIFVNGEKLSPVAFESWAYPRGQEPRRIVMTLNVPSQGTVAIEVVGGLILDRDAEAENYGAYFYCNHRLIVKELRTREVGYFVSKEAGVPHPDASLCRVVAKLQGPAQLMPWNSMKNDLNVGHPTYLAIRPTIIRLISHYTSLSRRLKNQWNGQVFRHSTGTIQTVEIADPIEGKKVSLPELPVVRTSHIDSLKQKNKKLIRDKPWTLGLIEAMSIVEISLRQRFDTKNRIALILLDSNFEIALKEYIVHSTKLFPPNVYNNAKIEQLFKNRENVIAEVTAKVAIDATLLDRTRHYYLLRNKLIHERATVGVTDLDIENYKLAIQEILSQLFLIKF